MTTERVPPRHGCPHCGAESDVEPGTFDGAEIHCYGCHKDSMLVTYEGGGWSLEEIKEEALPKEGEEDGPPDFLLRRVHPGDPPGSWLWVIDKWRRYVRVSPADVVHYKNEDGTLSTVYRHYCLIRVTPKGEVI